MQPDTDNRPDRVTPLLLALVVIAAGVAIALAYLVFMTVQSAEAQPTQIACLADLSWEDASFWRVIDGDTIEVIIADRVERVRYIGVDTPERGQPFYDEATRANRALLEGKSLKLARDVSDRDRYDRLLRYVIAGDRFVNLALVEQGMAQVATFPPDVRCADTFLVAQQQARAAGAGFWAARSGNAPQPGSVNAPRPGSGSVPQPGSAAPTRGNCHPSYPDVCIPPPPPDLDCADIPHSRFRVLRQYGDPHRFDGDSDGIGCEQ